MLLRLFAWLRQLPHVEFNVLAALFVAAAALFGFGALVDAVGEGETHKFDTAVLLTFRNPANHGEPIGPAWLQSLDISSSTTSVMPPCWCWQQLAVARR